MHSESLPFALEAPAFPLPAVAGLAGRLPLGGGREVVLATLLCGRLAHGVITDSALPPLERAGRAAAARSWLASLAIPAPLRQAFLRLVDASTGTPLQVAGALRALTAAVGGTLDAASVQELEQLARRLVSVGGSAA
jgi:hypothetical protein